MADTCGNKATSIIYIVSVQQIPHRCSNPDVQYSTVTLGLNHLVIYVSLSSPT